MRHPRLVALLFVLAAAPAAGCAAGPQAGAESTAPRRDQSLLNPAEIEEAQAANIMNLFDLVQQRRNQWLRARMTGVRGRMVNVTVWVDRVRMGGPDEMRRIPLAMIESVRYLAPSAAQAELGLDNMGGAILVTSRH